MDLLDLAVYLNLYRVKIWQEAPRGTLNGMADRIAHHRTLTTNRTYSAHFNEPP